MIGRKAIGVVLLAVSLLAVPACTRVQEPALLPLPKLVEYTGGSIKADCPVTETLVEAIPEALLNENEAYRLTIDKSGIHIEAVTEQGLWNARQTLRQLGWNNLSEISPLASLGRNDKETTVISSGAEGGDATVISSGAGGGVEKSEGGRGRIPCCRIVDWPSFRVRWRRSSIPHWKTAHWIL